MCRLPRNLLWHIVFGRVIILKIGFFFQFFLKFWLDSDCAAGLINSVSE